MLCHLPKTTQLGWVSSHPSIEIHVTFIKSMCLVTQNTFSEDAR